jgi:hypothetical protein
MRWHLMLAAVIGTGCVPLRGTAAPNETAAWLNDGLIARVHFAGTERILSDASVTNLHAIAALPQTAALRGQIFQKLAVAPYNFLRNRAATTNDETALIRPLLDDLFRAESFLELMDGTNQVPEMVFALRLDEERAQLWSTNLATVLINWCNLPVTSIKDEGFDGWELRKHHDPNVFRFFRAGNWVVLGWGEDELHLQPAILKRIRKTTRPVDSDTTNWLDAWADWPALALHHLAPHSIELPPMRLLAREEQDFIRSELTMKFAAPLELKLNPWQIPTNLIHNPIVSFTATRGLAPRLNETAEAKKFNLPPLPDQVYVWAVGTIPLETHLVAPVTDASNYMQQLAPGLVAMVNAFLSGHAPKDSTAAQSRGLTFSAVHTNNEIEIPGVPFLSPRLAPVHISAGDYLLGGLLPGGRIGAPLPPELIGEITGKRELFYYGWEFTGERLKQWRALFQLWQLLLNAGISNAGAQADKWIEALPGKLGNSATEVSLTAPDEVTMVRNSTIGFTAVELTALAHWLDSPEFPFSGYQETPRWRSVPAGLPLLPPAPMHQP